MTSSPEPLIAHRLRHLALAVATLATLVTPIELVFSKHYGEPAQFIPFVMVALTLLGITLVYRTSSAKLLRLFRGLMGLLFVVSVVGVFFHLRGNLEVVREIHPETSGWPLVWKVLSGAAPALAPGLLAQVGLLGLIYTYRHPVFTARKGARAKPTKVYSRHAGL